MLKIRFMTVVILTALAASGVRADVSLEDVRVFSDGVRVRLDARAPYDAFQLEDPPRVVLDLYQTSHLGKPRVIAVDGPMIRLVRTDQYASPPGGTARVVLELNESADFRVYRDGPELSVLLARVQGELRDAVAPLRTPAAVRALPPAPPAVMREDGAVLESIQLEEGSAALRLSQRVEFQTMFLRDPARLVVDLLETRRERWFRDRAQDDGLIRSVRTGIFSRGGKPGTRVVFELADVAPYRTSWEEGGLTVRFENASGATRDFSGFLFDESGAGVSGMKLLRFYWPGAQPEEFWSESVYVSADDGFFTARLGAQHPVPLKAEIDVATPSGSGWRVIPTNPRP